MHACAQEMRLFQKRGVDLLLKNGDQARKPLIDNTDDEQWEFIEGSAFNLRLAEVRIPLPGEYEGALIGVKERVTPPTKVVDPYDFLYRNKKYHGWVLDPGTWALLVSKEITNAPMNGFMPVKGRFTFASSFASIISTDAQPNYQGRITVLIHVGPLPLHLEKGCDFCFVRLAFLTRGASDVYKGVWGVEGYGSSTEGEVTRGK